MKLNRSTKASLYEDLSPREFGFLNCILIWKERAGLAMHAHCSMKSTLERGRLEAQRSARGLLNYSWENDK